MKKSGKAFAALAAGLALLLVGLTAFTLNGTAEAASDSADASLVMVQAVRGDLLVPGSCIGQTWPNIASECLIGEDGKPGESVRTITIGYQTEEAASVLVRMPAPELASN